MEDCADSQAEYIQSLVNKISTSGKYKPETKIKKLVELLHQIHNRKDKNMDKAINCVKGLLNNIGGYEGEKQFKKLLDDNKIKCEMTKTNTPYHDITFFINNVKYLGQIKTKVYGELYPRMKAQHVRKLKKKAKEEAGLPVLIEQTLYYPEEIVVTNLRNGVKSYLNLAE